MEELVNVVGKYLKTMHHVDMSGTPKDITVEEISP